MDATEGHYKVKYKDYIVQGGFLFQLSHTKRYPQHISFFLSSDGIMLRCLIRERSED